MPNVYITSPIPGEGIGHLRKKGFIVDINGTGSDLPKNALIDVVGKYDAVITLMTDKIDEEVINRASPRLKIIANYAVGYDNIDVLRAKNRGIVVTNTPGVASESVAEHTFAMILGISKNLIEADKFVRQGKYIRWDPNAFLSSQVWGKTIGIIGLGKIGTFVGQIAFSGFRMKILYHDRTPAGDFELLTEAKYCKLEELLTQSDIVTLHVPLLPTTFHLIGKSQFNLMKKDAILINTSRGPIVDEQALIWALRGKIIRGAALDVFEHEPNIAPELFTLANTILTPHSASATFETRAAMSRIAAQNVIDLFEGKIPLGLVKLH